MKKASYHNHSTFSDGAQTPEEYLIAARMQGIDILGFADHFYRDCPTPLKTPDWALQPNEEEHYFNTLETLANETKDIEIRIGLEFDWLEDNAMLLAPMASDSRLDYAIGSIHFVENESIDLSAMFWKSKSQDEVNEIIRRYWKNIVKMVNSSLFDIVGHLDLYKKFNAKATCDLSREISDALDAIKAADMVVELNTSGWHKDCRECYPNETLLKACFQREIPVTVSADAHRAELASTHFSRAYDILARVGYKSLARFRQRERFFEPLTF